MSRLSLPTLVRVALSSGVGIAALLALGGTAEASPHVVPAGCVSDADVYSGGNGSWDTAASWSTGSAPTSSVDACLPAGNYTVSVIAAQESVKSLTIGSGATLQLLGQALHGGQDDGVVTSAGSVSNAGTIVMGEVRTGTGANTFSARLILTGGTLVNTGTIDATPVKADSVDEISANVVNQGLINVTSSTFVLDGQSVTYDNAVGGSISITPGSAMIFPRSDAVHTFTLDGGSITNNGTFEYDNGTFHHASGTATGNPLRMEDVAINAAATSGSASLFIYDYASTLTSDVSSGDSLLVTGVAKNGVNQGTLTTTVPVTNAGRIVLTSDGGGPSYGATLALSGGTLTNIGALDVQAGGNGENDIYGNIVNGGAFTDESPDLIIGGQGSSLVSTGTIAIAGGASLVPTQAEIVTLAGGTFSNAGTYLQNGGTFNHTGGSATGYNIRLEDVALNAPGGGGTATFFLFDNGNKLTGDVGAGDTLLVNGYPKSGNDDGAVTTTVALTNAGSIVLTSDPSSNFGAYLNAAGGTLTNTGSITSVTGAPGGARELDGTIVNNGVITDQQSLGGSATLTNNGVVTVAAGQTLSVGSFTQTTGGTLQVVVAGGDSTYKQVLAGGPVSLAGSLSVITVASPSAVIQILQAPSVAGHFATVSFTGRSYTVGYTATAVTLGPAATTSTPTAKHNISLPSSTLSVSRSGVASVKLSCAKSSTSACVGKLTLTISQTTGSGKKRHKHVVTIGSVSFRIAPGKTATLSVHLSATGKSLLARSHGKLTVTAVVSQTYSGKTTKASKTVHLRQAPAAEKK